MRKLPHWLAYAAAVATPLIAHAAPELPALAIDLGQTTVSGLSSGAYMAGQFHVAFSSTVAGAGIFAGGPYGCAEGRLELALQRCMQSNLGPPDAAALAARASSLAAAGEIDPLANIADDRVYVFAGSLDRTVLPSVGARIPEFYARAGLPTASVQLEAGVAAGHGFPTENGPVACGDTAPPFVNDCDLDQAGALLAFFYGPLNPPADAPSAPLEFDQALYLASPEPRGMAATGKVYVPAECAAGASCRVHIVFHGCKQNEERVGEAVTAGSGFNRWAETNRIVVLYPQTAQTWSNPNACWDWWGFTGVPYDTRGGVQMAAVHRMLLALAGRASEEPAACVRHDDWNLNHWLQGRAIVCGFGLACAAGSGDPLGTFAGAPTVFESPKGFFTAEPCTG